MIIGSLYVTAGAVIIGVPIGILTAVFMAILLSEKNLQTSESGNRTSGRHPIRCLWIFRSCCRCSDHPRFRKSIKRCRTYKNAGDGNSILTASILLGMMILPTIIGTTESAMRASRLITMKVRLRWEQQKKEVFSEL